MINFFDTCSFLSDFKTILKNNKTVYISSISLKEIEHIKTNENKTEETREQARSAIQCLKNNEHKIKVIYFTEEDKALLKNYQNVLENNNDSKILISALKLATFETVYFYTQDIFCHFLAKELQKTCTNFVPIVYQKEEQKYLGYKIVTLSDTEMNTFYSEKAKDNTINCFDLKVNEYLIIKNESNEIIDIYKYTKDGYNYISSNPIKTRMFGDVKPKDILQKFAIDSFRNNQLTIIRGAAGTGKTMLSLSYLFELLEKHKIEKIIIFCNTVAVKNAAKLGYYPGEKDAKLLDSQIGNLLTSKLGSKFEAERLINENKMMLIPLSDIRGFDTTGMNAGIYISEAQNLDIELMRLALQRIGEDSICIIDGDEEAQVDLPQYSNDNNGIKRAIEVFKGQDFFGTIQLQQIFRSPIAEIAQLM